MSSSICRIKKHPLLPVFAALSSLFLLTGGIFNCCRINESLAEKLKEMFAVSVSTETHPSVIAEGEIPSPHPGCHGHGTPEESTVLSKASTLDGAQAILKTEGTCLSGLSLTSKAIASSEFPALGLPVATFWVGEKVAPQATTLMGKPRPHDKSSPRIYLTTLHILV